MKMTLPAVVTIGAASFGGYVVAAPPTTVENLRQPAPSATLHRTSNTGSFVGSWAHMVRSLIEASRVARADGHPIAPVASQLAYAFAAHVDVPGAPPAAVSDNEEGGVVFYWIAGKREIQVEIDGDSTYFVRVVGAQGKVDFIQEGLGEPPVREVRLALESWRDAFGRGPIQTLKPA